jgi:GNAT superfamily N-acetyltransferase
VTGLTFRTASAAELPTILSWASAEGWNPGLEDAACFHASDPNGFFVAIIDDTPVAAISVVNHTETLAFLGLYLCLPSYRGKGIGYGLWQHAISHAGERTIGLDGVPDQQGNYQKSGFVLTGRTFRYEGDVVLEGAIPMRPATRDDHPGIIALDAEACGYAKSAFMSNWLAHTANRETFVIDDREDLRAFATIRRCARGAKIGPFTARDIGAAKGLLAAIALRWPDRPLIIDIPDNQTELTTLAVEAGMTATFNTARMYRGKPPNPGRVVAAAGTLELG